MCIVFAEGVRILLFECDGYTGAPGSAGVAGVCGRLLGRSFTPGRLETYG